MVTFLFVAVVISIKMKSLHCCTYEVITISCVSGILSTITTLHLV